MKGLILAGGRATRLGPLAAQLNKSLVTVGQKPMLVELVQQLRTAGCDHVVVTVSPGAREQVQQVIERAGLPEVSIRVQDEPRGPGHALQITTAGLDGPGILIMADTMLGDVTELPRPSDLIAVAAAPSERSWCGYIGNGAWREGTFPVGHDVAVGAYGFSDLRKLNHACSAAEPDEVGEVRMAAVLNAYGRTFPYHVDSWLDVGDVEALADAQRKRFMSRSFNGLHLDDLGRLVKQGPGVYEEWKAIESLPEEAQHLFPRVFAAYANEYVMEHVDLPTLAELYLYWPAPTPMWEYATRSLLTQLERNLWPWHHLSDDEARYRAENMYLSKLRDRYLHEENVRTPAFGPKQIWVNGRQVMAGKPLIERVTHLSERLVHTAPQWRGRLHGDPAFTNVLWSLRTGNFKLIDPRGSWGGEGPFGDVRYDMGKIAASTILAPVMHRLFTLHQDNTKDGYTLNYWPERSAEANAITQVITNRIPREDLQLLMIHMLLSSAPLHDEPEGTALFVTAACMADRFGISK